MTNEEIIDGPIKKNIVKKLMREKTGSIKFQFKNDFYVTISIQELIYNKFYIFISKFSMVDNPNHYINSDVLNTYTKNKSNFIYLFLYDAELQDVIAYSRIEPIDLAQMSLFIPKREKKKKDFS